MLPPGNMIDDINKISFAYDSPIEHCHLLPKFAKLLWTLFLKETLFTVFKAVVSTLTLERIYTS